MVSALSTVSGGKQELVEHETYVVSVTVKAGPVLIFVPVVVVLVVVEKVVDVAIEVLVTVGMLRYDEQNAVSLFNVAKTCITSVTTMHSTSDMISRCSMGVALTPTPAKARRADEAEKSESCILMVV